MDTKITYLFGAGASFPTFPLSLDFKDKDEGKEFDGLIKKIDKLSIKFKEGHFSKISKEDYKSIDEKIYYLLNWAVDKSSKFQNIDTYSKYLYHWNKPKFLDLKKAIAIYFTVEQFDFIPEDKTDGFEFQLKVEDKYKNFFVSILDKKNNIPKNLNFLSWNYDFQFEATNRVLFPESSQFISFPTCAENNPPFDRPNLIHLNGVAGGTFTKMGGIIEFKKGACYVEQFYQNLEIIFSQIPLITFAWEEVDDEVFGSIDDRINRVRKMIAGSKILVVIGYSFPFYNRVIDGEIIKVLLDSGLEKIYFQSPRNNGSQLHSQFGIKKRQSNTVDKKGKLFGIPIEHISNCDQFFIPYEL